jgi:DNA (cytosine-5)-methyltransferase 1
VTHELTHLDLFSGIGGFALAAKWNGFRTLAFCDCEPYAQAVLKKHWPEVPCHKDIREVRGDLYAGVTLLTGGFPCQPFSVAGKQRGKDDDRYLWPQMLRVIREARPAWIIGENVAGIIGLALDQVCSDLEAEGYEVEPVIIPACAVDAPHRRDRVWILAHARNMCGRHGFADGFGGNGERKDEKKIRATAATSASGPGKKPETMADSERIRLERAGNEASIRKKAKDTGGKGRESSQASKIASGSHGSRSGPWKSLEANWPTESGICRVSHGVRNRVDRIKSLGNAIVPQVAAEIIRCIRKVSR